MASKAQKEVWLHRTLAFAWTLTIIPTLIWWRESVLWVAFMSLYANIVGHWGAMQAAKAEKNSSRRSDS